MNKVIEVELGASSIDKAIKELKEYEKSINDKLQEFIAILLQDGVQVANASMGSVVGDSTQAAIVVPEVMVDGAGNIVTAYIQLSGKDALFVEFGAGIYYNNGNAHPQAAEFGYGVGTYPSDHPPNRAINPGYWWYRGEDGALHFSLGTQASMPIYRAAESIRNNAIRKALEVFRS